MTDTTAGRRPLDPQRVATLAAIAASVVLVAMILGEVIEIATNVPRLAFPLDGDRVLYANAATSWLNGTGFYLPHQLAGPYEIKSGDILYPPPMLLVFAPLTFLPPWVYYAIPLGITAFAVVWLRPAPLGWPAILFCLWWPTTVVVIAGGNPGIWLMAFMALGCLWRPLSVLVFLKPTLAPFALFGINRRSWWIALAILGLVSLAFGALWLDFINASLNARGGGGVFYSIGQAPMLLLPLAAWATSQRRRRPAQPATAAAEPVEPAAE
jgi:hypothetical protein